MPQSRTSNGEPPGSGVLMEVTWGCLSQSQDARTKPVPILGLDCSPPHPQVTGQTPGSPPHFKQGQPQCPPPPFSSRSLQSSEASPEEENRIWRRREPCRDTLCVTQVGWGKVRCHTELRTPCYPDRGDLQQEWLPQDH